MDFRTIIPEYILEALIFAKQDFSTETISNILSYWIEQSEKIELRTDLESLKIQLQAFTEDPSTKENLLLEVESLTSEDHQLAKFLRKALDICSI